MKANKIITGFVLVSFLILGAGIILASRLTAGPEITVSKEAKAETVETNYSWGEIKLKNGEAKKSFVIKNTGTAVLQLFNVKTSCMCTTARVKIGDQASPFFGMHSNSSWVGEVLPGKEAELEVVFDAAYHGPSGVGRAVRQVEVETNDPGRSKINFELTADVVD